MPKKGKGKGKKGGGGGTKKGKKSGKSKSPSGVSQHIASATGLLNQSAPPVRIPILGERLLHVLTTHKVETKELHNMQLSIRALEQLTAQEVRDLLLVFQVFDSNMDGFLTVTEVRRALRALGFKVTREEVRLLVNDANQRGLTTDFNTFLDFVIDRQSTAYDQYDEILQAFTYFDIDKSGKISLTNLKQLSRNVGVKLSENDLKEMLEIADTNGDNAVDQQEFVKVMLQTHLFS